MSGSNLSERICCGQNIFSNTKKLKNNNKKVKKLQTLTNEDQKKNKPKQKKLKRYFHAKKHRMCTQKKKYEKVNIHKKYTELHNTRIHSILFWKSEMLLKFVIWNFFMQEVVLKFSFKDKGG